MSLAEITERVHSLGNAWEQFKQVNEARLCEVERKGYADPLYQEHLNKINNALDQYKQRVDTLETSMQRPVSGQGKSVHVPSEYGKVFQSYLRKGMDAELEMMQSKSLSVGNDQDGGYLVTPAMSDKIVDTVASASAMRALASIETISTDTLEILEVTSEADAGWTAEAAPRVDTDTPQLAKRAIAVHELYAQPKATQKLVDDAAIDVEQWLADKVADIFIKKENEAFISGDGVNRPRGILTYPGGTAQGQIEQVSSGSAGAVTADGLVNLYYSLKESYASRASFLMHRATLQAVRLLKESTTNQYIWQPGLSAGTPDTLLGVPVVLASDMPTPATDSLSIAVGDFEAAYQIVDRVGIRVLRDPFTDKPFIKFYTTKRVGGDVVNFDALKLQVLSA